MRHLSAAALPALVLALFLVVPQSVAGQGAAEWFGAEDPVLNEIDTEVMAPVVNGTTEFRKALEEVAERHARVADLRTEDDVERFDCLQKQAALLYYSGEVTKARKYMKRAAQHAEEMGHAYEAAMAYVDAALLAKEAGNSTAAAFLASRAKKLSNFAFLDASEREAIVQRVDGFNS